MGEGGGSMLPVDTDVPSPPCILVSNNLLLHIIQTLFSAWFEVSSLGDWKHVSILQNKKKDEGVWGWNGKSSIFILKKGWLIEVQMSSEQLAIDGP